MVVGVSPNPSAPTLVRPRRALALRVLPWAVVFVLEVIPGLDLPGLWGSLLVAPVGEDGLKFLGATGLLALAAGVARHRQRSDGQSFPPGHRLDHSTVVLIAFVAGTAFGVAEHYHSYPGELPVNFLDRVLDHIGFACFGWWAAVAAWRKGAGLGFGAWLGLATGALAHSASNLLASTTVELNLVEFVGVVGVTFAVPGILLVLVVFKRPTAEPLKRLLAVA